jgi:hypothetical protein
MVLPRNDLIASDSNGRFIHLGNWRNRLRNPAVATVGLVGIPDRGILRRTLYDGRRSFATALIHEGRSVVEVAGQLGHSSASTMLCHYARIVEAARAGDRVPLSDAVAVVREARAATPSAGELLATKYTAYQGEPLQAGDEARTRDLRLGKLNRGCLAITQEHSEPHRGAVSRGARVSPARTVVRSRPGTVPAPVDRASRHRRVRGGALASQTC